MSPQSVNQTVYKNSTRPDSGKGLSYIHHEDSGKTILTFVREQNKNEHRSSIAYVFIGEGKFLDTWGSKPMSIHWELKEPLPPYLWKASAKMAVG